MSAPLGRSHCARRLPLMVWSPAIKRFFGNPAKAENEEKSPHLLYDAAGRGICGEFRGCRGANCGRRFASRTTAAKAIAAVDGPQSLSARVRNQAECLTAGSAARGSIISKGRPPTAHPL